MRLDHERRRDDQAWVLDWVVKTTGRTGNFAYDRREFPAAVKSFAMIPKHMGRLGMHQEAIARAADNEGYRATALQAYRQALQSYHNAQHYIYTDDHPEKLRWYERLTECFDRVIALSPYRIERVEVPWEGKQIQCILYLRPGEDPSPCVLFIPGMDRVKEVIFVEPGEFLERGFNLMVMDGPGQGMSNIRKIRVSDDNYERAASAVVDYLVTRPEVDPDRIVALGHSMGSHWGIRTAANETRVKAVAVAASCLGGRRASSNRLRHVSSGSSCYMAGIHDEEAFDRMAARMTTVGFGGKIRCPTLLAVGEFDPLSPLEDAQDLFEEITAPKELWVLEDEAHASLGMAGLCGLGFYPFALDWLAKALAGGFPPGHSRVKWIAQSTGTGPLG